MKIKCILFLIGWLCPIAALWSQCTPPTLVQTREVTDTSISLSWLYFGEAQGWEMELVAFGESPTFEPTTGLITEKQFVFSDLETATSYDIYIRTVCTDGSKSDWNPVSAKTAVPQPSPCNFKLPIKNNNCRQGLESFPILVEGVAGRLGQDVFLSSVDIVLSHTWPADLDIRLTSPSGLQVLLSQNNGTVTDNFGRPDTLDCGLRTRFTDVACVSIKDGRPPFIGDFTPESPLFMLEDESDPNGEWKLEICDRSEQDLGFLNYVQLNFEPLICELPRDIIVKSVGSTDVEVVWTSYDGCELTEVELSLAGEVPGSLKTVSIPCAQESIILTDLDPDTEYDIYVLSNCLADQKSPLSCPYTFKTACDEVTEVETFDFLENCTTGCGFDCNINGLWTNQSSDDQDWIIHSGSTSTADTGPDNGVFDGGSYIYVESSPDICSTDARAVLESGCIQISSNEQACDLSFWYHMYGDDIGSLSLIIHVGGEVDTLFSVRGDQGNQWHNEVISLEKYNGQSATFSFLGITAAGVKGDIAIDQIELRGSRYLPEGITYYYDGDQDGYGRADSVMNVCNALPPEGFVVQSGDCDDDNALINPDADEVPCNDVDENCDGSDSDSADFEIIEVKFDITPDDCSIESTGKIDLSLSGGNPPYRYEWSNGATTQDVEAVSAGSYTVTISDNDNCPRVIGPIVVGKKGNVDIQLVDSQPALCSGQDVGSLTVEAQGGSGSYGYVWLDGASGAARTDLAAERYGVYAEDAEGCVSDTFYFDVLAEGDLKAAISFKFDVTCFGGDNGILRAAVISGEAPYRYKWTTGDTLQQIDDLAAGDYTCTITDKVGCTSIVSAAVSQPEELKSEVVSQENILCAGENTGSIQTNTIGGTPPYSFLWNTGDKTDDIFDLAADSYWITVSDANACRAISDSIHLTEPPVFSAVVDSAVFAKCILSQDGLIRVQASGGIPSYNYFWSTDEQDTTTLNGINPGVYSITITDRNECKTAITNIKVDSESKPLQVVLDLIGENVCSYDSLISISAQVEDAAFPLDYNWSSGVQRGKYALGDTLVMLPSGTYNLSVTDAEGCIGVSDSLEVLPVEAISFEVINKEDNTCPTDSVGELEIIATGGTAPYRYLWSNGVDSSYINDLPNGKYSATITDNNGCVLTTQNISVRSTSDLMLDVTVKNSDSGKDNGSILLNITGGLPPYRVNWSDGIAQLDETEADSLSMGIYKVYIEDFEGCTIEVEIEVDESNSIERPSRTYVHVSPNPFVDYVEIYSPNTLQDFQLYTIQGELIQQDELKGETAKVSIPENLPKGLYLLLVKTEKGTVTKKVVKF